MASLPIITELGGLQEQDMGLIDILNGMQNGPRGPSQPNSSGKGGGMSPMMMALLGLVAYKAVNSMGGQPAVRGGAGSPPPSGGSTTTNQQGGGIGDILGSLLGGKPGSAPATNVGGNPNASLKELIPGGLGKVLGGATAGTALSGGLGALTKEFQQGGLGQAAQSWVGTGPNQKIVSTDLERVLGTDTLDALSKQTGVGRDDLLAGLSQHLPDLIDQLTPNGRLPSEAEASRMV
jgi:uncharacterized protein YidB (DUF937 family)